MHDGVPPRDAARYWLTVARLGIYSMRRESFEAALRAADLYRQLGDDSRRYDALLCAAVQGMRFASAEEMEQAIAEATRLERPDWPARQRANLQFARCWWYARLGRYEEALACAQQQVAINREGGNLVGEQYAMSNVTAMELLLGRPEAALEHARAAIARLDALGASAGAGHLYNNTMIASDAAQSCSTRRWPRARTAHTLLLQEGDEYRLFAPLALLAALQGRLADAARIIGHDDAVHSRTGDPHGRTRRNCASASTRCLAARCLQTNSRACGRKAPRCATSRYSSWVRRRSVNRPQVG